MLLRQSAHFALLLFNLPPLSVVAALSPCESSATSVAPRGFCYRVITISIVSALAMASKLLLQRRLVFKLFQLSPPSSPSSSYRFLSVKASEILGYLRRNTHHLPPLSPSYRTFCSRGSNLLDESQAPTAIYYRSILQEGEFHRLADSTIHTIQEKLEDYGDIVEVDGFDIDYGNDVLTVKLGDLGTYVLNKQTPNRQLWLSSPLSGPSRFDWDQDNKAWIYRRTKANLYEILEFELEQLCGKPIVLS